MAGQGERAALGHGLQGVVHQVEQRPVQRVGVKGDVPERLPRRRAASVDASGRGLPLELGAPGLHGRPQILHRRVACVLTRTSDK